MSRIPFLDFVGFSDIMMLGSKCILPLTSIIIKKMTVKECYEQMGSDYEGVLGRLGSEAIVKRFALKFLQDPSFAQLKESLAKNDGEEAFRAAHTLKGVCLNLGFDELFEVSAELTEKLRERETAGSEELFQKVSQKYQKTVTAIQGLE